MKLAKYIFGMALILFVVVAARQEIQATATLQVDISVSGGGICAGGQTAAWGTASASGGTAPYTFTWIGDANQTSSPTDNPNYATLNAGPGTVNMCVTVTSADGQSKTVSGSTTLSCGGGGF